MKKGHTALKDASRSWSSDSLEFSGSSASWTSLLEASAGMKNPKRQQDSAEARAPAPGGPQAQSGSVMSTRTDL